MADDRMPAPLSSYALRRHLAEDHDDERHGWAFTELAKLHQSAHDADAGHTHEVPTDHCPRCGYGPLLLTRRPPRKKCPACHVDLQPVPAHDA